MLKQRNGVVLVRDRGWFTNAAYGELPHSMFPQLKARLGKPEPSVTDVFAALALLANHSDATLGPVVARFPITALTPRVRVAAVAFGGEKSRGQRDLLSPEGVKVVNLSTSTRQKLASAAGAQWKGAVLAGDPLARIRLEYQAEAGSVRLGYIITTPSAQEVNTPTFRARGMLTSLFVREEEDE